MKTTLLGLTLLLASAATARAGAGFTLDAPTHDQFSRPTSTAGNGPAGPPLKWRPRLGVALGGASLFVAAWTAEMVVAFQLGGYYKKYGIPFAGPFFAARDDLSSGGRITGPLYILDGVAQITGAGMLAAGLLSWRPVPKHPCAQVRVLPFTGRSRGGLSLVGRF